MSGAEQFVFPVVIENPVTSTLWVHPFLTALANQPGDTRVRPEPSRPAAAFRATGDTRPPPDDSPVVPEEEVTSVRGAWWLEWPALGPLGGPGGPGGTIPPDRAPSDQDSPWFTQAEAEALSTAAQGQEGYCRVLVASGDCNMRELAALAAAGIRHHQGLLAEERLPEEAAELRAAVVAAIPDRGHSPPEPGALRGGLRIFERTVRELQRAAATPNEADRDREERGAARPE